ncbi:MAG: hypothetical protein M5U28_49680 [Sandaracinaceae bacterium]|nr:hypothetical protein [Sandaracinaceae bacterium]
MTLQSLQGDPNSALMRRLVRGFIVSLDRDFRAGPYGRRYYRTIANGFVPYAAMGAVSSPDFRGARLDDVTRLPIGYILRSRRRLLHARPRRPRASRPAARLSPPAHDRGRGGDRRHALLRGAGRPALPGARRAPRGAACAPLGGRRAREVDRGEPERAVPHRVRG